MIAGHVILGAMNMVGAISWAYCLVQLRSRERALEALYEGIDVDLYWRDRARDALMHDSKQIAVPGRYNLVPGDVLAPGPGSMISTVMVDRACCVVIT